MFMNKQRCLFFIEEPDLSMHPGMQRALLEGMTRHNQHQYFLTTHSNHLLDMSSEFKEMFVYLFSKECREEQTNFKVSSALSPGSNILNELGVHNSSVFLTNATIWVEGVTDRLYLRSYLKKYCEHTPRKLREDYHYSFVEYQGSNLTHWTFDENDQSAKIKANYLCGHSFLIADGDVSNKGTRRADYEEMLGDRFFILECKEIENLIPSEVLKEIVKDEFKKADKDVNLIDYSRYSLSGGGLGKYLDELLGRDEFASATGTVKDKVNFCEKAFELMARSDFQWQLTPPLNALCEKVYKFVLNQNL
jgi:predicted ATP-dependent endonuclease of OLD family